MTFGSLRGRVSIHAPRVGSDVDCFVGSIIHQEFQSTLPAWGATALPVSVPASPTVSIHAPRVGSDKYGFNSCNEITVSIHAPRVGSDVALEHTAGVESCFNPRSPRGERRAVLVAATSSTSGFNPRSPRGERHLSRTMSSNLTACFNPRSPRGERRLGNNTLGGEMLFQSTLPAWGATADAAAVLSGKQVSIHAPRVGSDWWSVPLPSLRRSVSIHAPRVGSDDGAKPATGSIKEFQSTLPAWGATKAFGAHRIAPTFQSTLPAWGATLLKRSCTAGRVFQSTLPAWGATPMRWVT